MTRETDVQTPIDGMQTGRSSDELTDHFTRWWFVQIVEKHEMTRFQL